MGAAAADTKEDSDSSDEEQEESMVDKIPRSHEIKLNHSDKAITALSLDPSGRKCYFVVQLWDLRG